MEYRDLLPPENEYNKECAECGTPHVNNGNYCSLLCANESMR